MVPVLVLLTFAALVALHRFVLAKGYLDVTSGWPQKLEVLPQPAAERLVPEDVFLQPTYTWGRVGEWGTVCLGVHPMLLRLIGASGEIELRPRGDRVAKGEALARLGLGGRRLTVRSPIAGQVVRVNRRAAGETRWLEVEDEGGPWLYCLRPEPAADETPRWLRGAAALDWTRGQYRQLRTYLQSTVVAGHLGAVMADGGELPVGILAETDQGVWTGLERRFLAPEGTMALRSRDRADTEGWA